jgi:hypothetical protein
MQHILLLIIFVVSPILLFAQDSDTERRMQELGFVKVDLNELSKTQSTPKKACSSCPLKQVKTTSGNPTINHQHEIEKLENQLPSLEQAIKDAQVAGGTDPMLPKYQTALKNTKDKIKALEKEFTQSKSSSK